MRRTGFRRNWCRITLGGLDFFAGQWRRKPVGAGVLSATACLASFAGTTTWHRSRLQGLLKELEVESQ